MHLFLYGTLRDPDLLTRFTGRAVPLTPVTLRDWRLVALCGSHYPTLRRARGNVEGVLAIVNRPTLTRLAVCEGLVLSLDAGNGADDARQHANSGAQDWMLDRHSLGSPRRSVKPTL
jgi:hypothetical protein